MLRRYPSANESQVWLMDVASGQTRQLLPAPEARGADRQLSRRPLQPGWTQLWIATDRFGEFTELARLDIASGTWSACPAISLGRQCAHADRGRQDCGSVVHRRWPR